MWLTDVDLLEVYFIAAVPFLLSAKPRESVRGAALCRKIDHLQREECCGAKEGQSTVLGARRSGGGDLRTEAQIDWGL